MATLESVNSNVTATVYTAATEVVAITSTDQINTLDASQGMVVKGQVNFTAGATPGTVTARVRQGSGLAGAVVGAPIVLGTTVAAVVFSANLIVVDPAPLLVGAGNAALPVYTITLTVAGSNGTGTYAVIEVDQPTGQN
jgi:hypothetical protein